MKRIKKAVLLLLCLVFVPTHAACGKSGASHVVDPNADISGTVHENNSVETDSYLLRDGQTDYAIVLPAGYGETLDFAAAELSDRFAEATGFELPVMTDEGLSFTEDGRYISLGGTTLAAGAGIAAGSELTSAGYIIRTSGMSVFVAGGGDTGTLNGVYGLLGELFGYEYFAEDCYALAKDMRDVRLMQYDIREIPDFEFNAAGYGYLDSDVTLLRRLRMVNYIPMFGYVNGGLMHNSFNWLDPAEHKAAHGAWYSDDGTQLCYTAHGKAAEYEAMVETAFEQLKAALIEDGDMTRVILAHQDTQTWCGCDACTASLAKYHANAASVVRFINRIMEMTEAWFAGEGAAYERDLTLYLLAYHQTNAAPVEYDEATGAYRAVDDTVRMRDDVGVWFAETNGDYTIPFTEGINAQYAANLQGWAALTDNLLFWNYSSNVTHYLAPYNSFNITQLNYKFAKQNKVSLMFDQASTSEKGAVTGWAALKVYLSSKLAWNVNADVEALTDAFFTNYFGPAAAEMRAWFENYRRHAAYIENTQNYGGSRSIFINALQEKFWPKPVLDGWMAFAEAAVDDLAWLETSDPALYRAYYDRIALERVSPMYLTVQLYSSLLTFETEAAYKNTFYEDTMRLGMTHVSESFDSENISSLYESWGLT